MSAVGKLCDELVEAVLEFGMKDGDVAGVVSMDKATLWNSPPPPQRKLPDGWTRLCATRGDKHGIAVCGNHGSNESR